MIPKATKLYEKMLTVWSVDARSLIVYSLDGISYSPCRHQRIVVIDRASRINGV